jgi:hypothetical protein
MKDAAGMAKPSADTVRLFASQLASVVCLSDGCAIELMQMLEVAGLVDADKKRAIDLVNAKLRDSTSDDTVANDKDKQENLYFEQYLQLYDPDAKIVAHPNTSNTVRFQALARIARKLGMNHLTEKGKARVMAAAFHDSDPEMKFSINSEVGNNIFRSFKLFLQKSPVLVPGREPFNFPPFQNFESEHPVVYAAAGFVPGTIHPIFEPMVQQNIVLLSDNVPLRRSAMAVRVDRSGRNAGVTTPVRSASEDGRTRAARMQNSLERSASIAGLEGLPGFRWCPPNFSQPQESMQRLGQPPVGYDQIMWAQARSPLALTLPPISHEAPLGAPPVGAPQIQTATLPIPKIPEQQIALPQIPEPQPPAQIALPQIPGLATQTHVQTMLSQMADLRKHIPEIVVRRMIKGKQPAPNAYKQPAPIAGKKKKTKKKAADGGSHKKKAPAGAAAAGKKKKAPRNRDRRVIDVQHSISVVLARTGLATFPKSKSISYVGPGGLVRAKRAAEAWLVSRGV